MNPVEYPIGANETDDAVMNSKHDIEWAKKAVRLLLARLIEGWLSGRVIP